MANLSQDARDEKPPVWDMSQERLLIMTMINQRLQFLLVFFSLVVAGALNARTQQHMSIVLVFGSVIGWIVALMLFQSQRRLDSILDIILADETHPLTVVSKRMTGGMFRVQAVLSYVVPTLCCLTTSAGAVLSFTGHLAAAPRA